jgi:hypothetical protein
MPYVSPAARKAQTRVPPPAGAGAAGRPKAQRRPGRDFDPMPSAPKRGSSGFVAGLGVGIAVGAAIALLLAPQSGADTRRALRRRGRRVRNRTSDAWEDLRLEFARAKRALRRKRRQASEPPVDD